MSAGFHDFKVIQKDGTQFKTVMLDGQELQGVVGVEVDMEVDTLTKVTLEILTNHCELHLKEQMDIGLTVPVRIYADHEQVFPNREDKEDKEEADDGRTTGY